MSNVIITGSTGMIGKGVLLECIKNPSIQAITLINRSPVDIQNSKIKEIILSDFLNIDTVKEQLTGLDGCFHCMGVSSMRMSEDKYTKLTFDITKKLADLCFELNPKMTFNYVSGTGTSTSEKGRQMWARIKGRTENYILSKGFEKSYMFRPGFIIPENGIKSRTRFYQRIYNILSPFFPLLKKMNSVTTTGKIGKAMVNTLSKSGTDSIYLENREINKTAEIENQII